MSTTVLAARSVDKNLSCPKADGKHHSKSKRKEGVRDQSVDALLHIDDLEYKCSIIRPGKSSTKDQSSENFKRGMIPALPSRHGSRADSVVPLCSQHSPARLRAEKILSKTNEFHALFEDSDYSLLDQPNEFEVRMKGEVAKPENLYHSMAMNVWRANKVQPMLQTQTKPIYSHKLHLEASSHSTPNSSSHMEFLNSSNHDGFSEPLYTVSYKYGSIRTNPKGGVVQETSPRVTAKSMHVSKLGHRNNQVSDTALHGAIVNNVAETIVQQPFQPQASPYVSLLNIEFAADVSANARSDGPSMSSFQMLGKFVAQEPKPLVETSLKKKSSGGPEKQSYFVKVLQEKDRKRSPNVTDSVMNDIIFQSESPFETLLCDSQSPAQIQKIRESTTLPPLQPKVRMAEMQNLLHEPLMHPKTCDLKSQQCLSKADFELIGITISSDDNVEKMVSRSVLFEAIERNVDERNEICFDIDRYSQKLHKQWHTKQNTMLLCSSNTRLQGSARSRLLAVLRALRQNQDDFFALAQQCHVVGCESSGMSRKIARWKQDIGYYMHELVKLPSMADAINEIATEEKGQSNSFKSSIGNFSGCAKVDLATAAACSKLLLGSKDAKNRQQNDAKFFRIFGNNVAPSNGQISSIMLSPSEPLEEYNKVRFVLRNYTRIFVFIDGFISEIVEWLARRICANCSD
jgi:hypothetical protein